MRDLRTLPKVELHIHIEGSLRAATARELADRAGVPVPHGLRDDDTWAFRDATDFIACYGELCGLLGRLDDFHRMGVEFCEDLAATGVRYAEAVFSPSAHARRFDDGWVAPIEALLDGLAAGERSTGVRVRLCPDIVRDLGHEAAERTLDVALRFAGAGVVALNAAGSERVPVAAFGELFRRAKAAGLGSVPHAGGWAGPESIWATLEHYAPDRIGHGVAAARDPRLMEHLAATGLCLEIAPVSNVATGVAPSLAEHPFPTLRDAGVTVTLNSDDPAMFGAWLTEVYVAAREAWDLDDATLAELTRTAARSSFADPATRTDLLAGIDTWLAGDEDGAPAPLEPGALAGA